MEESANQDLQNRKIEAEVEKLFAEKRKIENETKPKWANRAEDWFKVLAAVVVFFSIAAYFINVANPLFQSENIKLKRDADFAYERARLMGDSLSIVSIQLKSDEHKIVLQGLQNDSIKSILKEQGRLNTKEQSRLIAQREDLRRRYLELSQKHGQTESERNEWKKKAVSLDSLRSSEGAREASQRVSDVRANNEMERVAFAEAQRRGFLYVKSAFIKKYHPRGNTIEVWFYLPKDGNVSARVYDLNGFEVCKEVNENFSKGLNQVVFYDLVWSLWKHCIVSLESDSMRTAKYFEIRN